MRHYKDLVLVAVAGGLLLTGCNSAEQKNGSTPAKPAAGQTANSVYADGVRRVTPTELQAMMNRNEVVVVDVRNEDAYKTAHVRGAKLIPEADVAKRSNELPKDKLIVTYCSWPNEHTSARAVVDLKAKGIENAAALLGGFVAWQNAGFAVEKNAPAAKN